MGHLQVFPGGPASFPSRLVQQAVVCVAEQPGASDALVDGAGVTADDVVLTVSDDGLVLTTSIPCPSPVPRQRVDATGSPAV